MPELSKPESIWRWGIPTSTGKVKLFVEGDTDREAVMRALHCAQSLAKRAGVSRDELRKMLDA